MLKKILGIGVLLLSCTDAWSATSPQYAKELASFSASAKIGEDMTRLRISVASDSLQTEKAVRIGDIILCSNTDCYRAHSSGYIDIADTSRGAAATVADSVMPAGSITDIYFDDIVASAKFDGHLKFDNPVLVEKGPPAIELFIGVRRQQVGRQTIYAPIQAASMYFNPESELVHYLPGLQTIATLPQGTTLTIPAGALNKPQVFNVGILNVGETFPKIDIYPYVKLSKAATVETTAVSGGSSSRDMIVPAFPAEQGQEQALQATPGSNRKSRIVISQTAVIEPIVLENAAPYIQGGAPTAGPAASGAVRDGLFR